MLNNTAYHRRRNVCTWWTLAEKSRLQDLIGKNYGSLALEGSGKTKRGKWGDFDFFFCVKDWIGLDWGYVDG